MAPALLFGYFAAGIMHMFISPEMVKTHLGKRSFLSILKASLFGIPLPLCSCGVIPVTVSLRKSGASKGAATSFVISTPQTGVDSIFVTWSMLGPIFAVFRPFFAFVAGIAGGSAVEFFDNSPSPEQEIQQEKENSCCHAPTPEKEEHCCECTSEEIPENKHDECPSCHDSPEEEPEKKEGKIHSIFRYAFVTLIDDTARPLLLGIFIAGAISWAVPPEWHSHYIGKGFLSMLIMMAAGIPLYVCATASVPIAAAFLAKGISPGAVLVFLMTGPATNAATITAIAKFMGRRALFIYLASIVSTALLSGFTLNAIYTLFPKGARADTAMLHTMNSLTTVQRISGFILIFLIASSVISGIYKKMLKK